MRPRTTTPSFSGIPAETVLKSATELQTKQKVPVNKRCQATFLRASRHAADGPPLAADPSHAPPLLSAAGAINHPRSSSSCKPAWAATPIKELYNYNASIIVL